MLGPWALTHLYSAPKHNTFFFRLRDDGYEIGVTQRPEDSLWNIIRRGLAGLDALEQEEENLKKKFNMAIKKK